MSSAIGLSSPTRNQASIPLSQSFQGVQDFSKFDAAELSGYVEAEGASSYRTSVKLSIVKNGAGVYEVAASDIAGDDVSGSPLVSFQMTGSLLEAKIDSGVASFSSATIKFALISPPNSAGSLSLDAASVVSGTIDSERLPKKKIQTKSLSLSTSTNTSFFHAQETSTGVFGNSSFRIDNLVIGQLYRLRIRSAVSFSSTSAYTSLFPEYISPTGGETYPTNFQNRVWYAASQGTAGIEGNSLEVVFTATSSSIGFKQSYGSGVCIINAGHTRVTIEELTDYEEVGTF